MGYKFEFVNEKNCSEQIFYLLLFRDQGIVNHMYNWNSVASAVFGRFRYFFPLQFSRVISVAATGLDNRLRMQLKGSWPEEPILFILLLFVYKNKFK